MGFRHHPNYEPNPDEEPPGETEPDIERRFCIWWRGAVVATRKTPAAVTRLLAVYTVAVKASEYHIVEDRRESVEDKWATVDTCWGNDWDEEEASR